MSLALVDRLRRDLRHHLHLGAISQQAMQQVRNRVARGVLAALRDDEHPLTLQVQQLKGLAKKPDQQAKAEAEAAVSEKTEERQPLPWPDCLFLPNPGISPVELRRYWLVQLLLGETAASNHGLALAELLGLGSRDMEAALQRTGPHTVAHWSVVQRLSYLSQALDLLDAPALPPVELDGNRLCCGEREARLSPQETRFFGVLEKSLGEPVSYETLRREGKLNDPRKIKSRLMRKAEAAGIPVQISSPMPKYYQLDAQ